MLSGICTNPQANSVMPLFIYFSFNSEYSGKRNWKDTEWLSTQWPEFRWIGKWWFSTASIINVVFTRTIPIVCEIVILFKSKNGSFLRQRWSLPLHVKENKRGVCTFVACHGLFIYTTVQHHEHKERRRLPYAVRPLVHLVQYRQLSNCS